MINPLDDLQAKEALKGNIIKLLIGLVLLCSLLQFWINSAKNEAAKYDTPKPQDTTINLRVSTGVAQLEEPQDTVQDVYFVGDWENEAVIK
jgi:hypothetical protein